VRRGRSAGILLGLLVAGLGAIAPALTLACAPTETAMACCEEASAASECGTAPCCRIAGPKRLPPALTTARAAVSAPASGPMSVVPGPDPQSETRLPGEVAPIARSAPLFLLHATFLI